MIVSNQKTKCIQGQKQWWAPVWTGLVMDSEAKHYRRMKNALWLFLYIVLNANRKSGFLVRKIKTISSDTGINQNTILRWLNILRKQGYITTQNTGRGLLIQIKEWENPSSDIGKNAFQKQQISNSCGWENPITDKAFNRPNQLNSDKKPVGPIDISINKDILNIDIDRKDSSDSQLKAFKRFKPRNKQQLLALDLARELNDLQGLPFYLSRSKKYPESLLRRVLGQVKEVPSEKITKSRAALFNHLIQKYDQKDSQNLSH